MPADAIAYACLIEFVDVCVNEGLSVGGVYRRVVPRKCMSFPLEYKGFVIEALQHSTRSILWVSV